MAALLRFQQQREGRIAADIDALDRVHLDGDVQLSWADGSSGWLMPVRSGRVRTVKQISVLASNAADQMARQASAAQPAWRRNACLEFGVSGCAQPGLGGGDDAAALARRHRIGGVIEAGARLDLDEATGCALRATMSISPSGVRKRRARMRKPLAISSAAARLSADRPVRNAATPLGASAAVGAGGGGAVSLRHRVIAVALLSASSSARA